MVVCHVGCVSHFERLRSVVSLTLSGNGVMASAIGHSQSHLKSDLILRNKTSELMWKAMAVMR